MLQRAQQDHPECYLALLDAKQKYSYKRQDAP